MPRWFKVFASRVTGWLRWRSVDTDFDAELRSHLDMLEDDNLRRGMAPAEAARLARITLGGVTQLKEQYRERSGLPWIESLWQDARYAVRLLGRHREFTLLAVLTIAVGIGVNTTVFSVVNAVAFKPLPVRNGDRLVRIKRWFDSGARGDVQYAFSWDEYQHYSRNLRSFSGVVAVAWPSRVLTDGKELLGLAVSDNYFTALGATAALGTTFHPSDDGQSGPGSVVVLSEPAWRTRFGTDVNALGKTLRINGVTATVIGVMPGEFIGTGNPPQVPDFWVPLGLQASLFPNEALRSRPELHRLQLLAFADTGTSLAQAEAELNVLRAQLAERPETHIPFDKTVRISLQPATYFGGTDDARFQASVALVMGIVAMILVAACANLANMLLARASTRRREIGMRLALGATRARVVRQLLTENVLLTAIAGAIGFVFSTWASRVLWTFVEQIARSMFFTEVPFVASLRPDLRVFGFAFAVSLATGLLVGLSPALTASRSALAVAVSSGQRTRLRAWSTGAQAAVAMAFLVCSGLLVKGVSQSAAADPGFDTRTLFLLGMSFDPNADRARALQDRIVEALTGSPGIESVAMLDRFPFAGTWSPPVVVEADGSRIATRALGNYVSSNYFRTAGIPIERGRTFTSVEARESAAVAIVSESAARRFWPDQDPIGKRLNLDLTFKGQFTAFDVVGVVGDVRSANLSRVDPAYVYLPTRPGVSYNLVIRSAKGAPATSAAVRAVVEALDRGSASSVRVASLHDAPMMQSQLLMAQSLATFAAALTFIAIVLAAVGVYGVTSYFVSQRTQEIGIRMALGATATDVRRLIVRQGVTPVIAGSMVGLALAAVASIGLHSTLINPAAPDLLFGVRPWDPVSFVVLPTVLAAVAAAASYVPARRATTVDPLLALRRE